MDIALLPHAGVHIAQIQSLVGQLEQAVIPLSDV